MTNSSIPLPDIQLNYTSVLTNLNQMVAAYMAMADFSGPILPTVSEFNMTAQNIVAMKAAEKLMKTDPYQ